LKDKKLLRDIFAVGVNVKGVEAMNNMIRQHFVELTQRFLQPLNRYFDSLVLGNPAAMTLASLRVEPDIKPFLHDQFIKTIESNSIFVLYSPHIASDCKKTYCRLL
jgi:hypothetical protein